VAIMGRPREFDLNDALDRAIEVFWRNGYEGASVAELCEAMGIKPPSLYAAFENKEGLFRHAIERYLERRVGYWDEALEAPSAREMVERLVRGCIDFLTEKGNPPGCLFVRSAASCSEAADCIRQELAARRAEGEARLRERLERAATDGELPPDLDPAGFARYLMAVLEGMTMRATVGASREELRQVGEMVLRAWPA